MAQTTQEELRKKALYELLLEELPDVLRDGFWGKLIIEVENGQAIRIRSERTRLIKDRMEKISEQQKS